MTWHIDHAHSHINFHARHMMISKVRGSFESFTGSIEFDPEDMTNTIVRIDIDAASINTRSKDRDNHLRSQDFLNVEKYPLLTFRSGRLVQTAPDRGKLVGDLTIRGVTNEVVLDVEHAGIVVSPWGPRSAGFSARAVLNRHDWGASWNVILETGGVLVGDHIHVDIDLELMEAPQAEPEAAGEALANA